MILVSGRESLDIDDEDDWQLAEAYQLLTVTGSLGLGSGSGSGLGLGSVGNKVGKSNFLSN